jgi:hypothetical protein
MDIPIVERYKAVYELAKLIPADRLNETGKWALRAVEELSRAEAQVASLTAERDEAKRRALETEQANAVLSTAFHEVLCDYWENASTFQQEKQRYLAEAAAENKMIESLLPRFMEIAGMGDAALSPAVPAEEKEGE